MTAATATLTHGSNYNGWTVSFEGDDEVIGWGDADGKYDELLAMLVEWSERFADSDGYTGLDLDDITDDNDDIFSRVVNMLEAIDGSVIVKYEIDTITT